MKKLLVTEMDERQKLIVLRTTRFTLLFVNLCLIAAMIVRLIKAEDIGWEFWVIIAEGLVFFVTNRILGNIDQPKDLWNRPLPTGSSPAERRARKKNYALDSLIFAAAMTLGDILFTTFSTGPTEIAELELTKYLFPNLDKLPAVAITAVISFVTMFLISYTADWLVVEKIKVKQYNKMLSELDED